MLAAIYVLSRSPYGSATNLLAGTVSRYVVLALNIGVGVVLMPFTVKHLGQTDYGLWMLVASMTTYFQLLDLGYGNGIVRHLVDADRRGDAHEVNRIASTFVCVYAVIACIAALLVGVMVVAVVPRFPHLSAAQVRVAQVLLALLGARIAIGFPLTVFGAVTNAREGFVLNHLVAGAIVSASALSTYAVLGGGGGLATLVGVTTAVNIVGYAGYAWTAYHVMPELRIRLTYFSASRWREVTSFSVYLFVIQLASQISFSMDNVIIGASLGPALVAVYTVALRLAEYQRRLCDQFSGMLFPVIMRLGENVDALQQALIEGNRVATTLVTGASIVLIGFSGPLVIHWMGPSFNGSVIPFVILAVAGAIVVSQAASSNVLIACGAHRLVAGIWMGEAVANLLLSVVLVRSMGLVGVAIGTCVPLLIGHLFIMFTSACRTLGVSMATCLYETTRPALVAGAFASSACLLLRVTHPPASTAVVLAEALCVAVVYIVALATVGFDRRTRTLYASQGRAVIARLMGWVLGRAEPSAADVDDQRLVPRTAPQPISTVVAPR